MKTGDHAYYEARAEQEIAAARRSRDVRAVRAHYRLANYYLDLIHGPGLVSDSDYASIATGSVPGDAPAMKWSQ